MIRVLRVELCIEDLFFHPHLFSFQDDLVTNIQTYVERSRLHLMQKLGKRIWKITGPCYSYQNESVYPLPRVFYGPDSHRPAHGEAFDMIHPGKPVACDLGQKLLPVVSDRDFPDQGSILKGWITRRGLEALRANQQPDIKDIHLAKKIFSSVFDPPSRGFGNLKVIFYVHMRDFPSQEVLKELKQEKKYKIRISNIEKNYFSFAKGDVFPAKGIFISLMTSMITDRVKEVLLNGPLPLSLPCISASTPWPLRLFVRRKQKKFYLIPEGSTWFYYSDSRLMRELQQLKRNGAGEWTVYGYGKCFAGPWGG
ncbi:hypothetical protein [Lihuaxuella thermophila]|uniref:Uncharacterized protein n=1 Tax=Lihuaxuella thermophila TaxID=1173111 RepID=A0A1H8CZX3_9BACL|nr:hypothetical protein [Lihuaxuella thermophila]SEN00512.1 hypothetical protein SAMN05444955_104211 [Lihuaxuella thermophila]